MKKSYASDVVFLSTPEQISQLLHLDETKPEPWQEDDLPAMIQHQMSAPLEFDLGSAKLSGSELKTASESFASATHSNIRTFGELLKNPRPPLDLLRLSQKFFRQKVKEHPKGSSEQKLSYLFYLLSIVVARIRHGANISRLTDDEQLQAIKSMIKKTWVEEKILELLSEGRKRIGAGSDR